MSNERILDLVRRFAEARTAKRYSEECLALTLLYEAAVETWSVKQEGKDNG